MMNNENEQPLSTQGDTNAKKEQLSCTTNLSAEQLKEQGGTAGTAEDNPDHIENPDDLHEIQAGDDLDEPDAESYLTDQQEDKSVKDADGNGGYPDEADTIKEDDQDDVTGSTE